MLRCRRADKFPGNEHATKTPHAHAALHIADFSLSHSCALHKHHSPRAHSSCLCCVFSRLSAFARLNLTDSTPVLADVQVGLVDTLVTNGILDLVLSKIAPRAPPPSGGEAMIIMIDRGRRGAQRALRRGAASEALAVDGSQYGGVPSAAMTPRYECCAVCMLVGCRPEARCATPARGGGHTAGRRFFFGPSACKNRTKGLINKTRRARFEHRGARSALRASSAVT